MKPNELTKVTIVIEDRTWEETQRMVLENGELVLHMRLASLDDCARQAMLGVGLPRPVMTDSESADFDHKQCVALGLAKQRFEAD